MKKLLDYASHMYYSGTPIMTDDEFDKLADYYDYESVGAAVVGDSIPHAFPMWSLQKCYTDEERILLNGSQVVVTPKLDGAAIAIYYVHGKLSFALTRGDGKEGKNITENVQEMATVPFHLKEFEGIPLVQVTGEVVAPKEIENARNYAAGALQLKDVVEFQKRELTFIAYGLMPRQNGEWATDMGILSNMGFYTVLQSDWREFPHDGEVWRLNAYQEFEDAGYTSKHPRGAYALKERKGGVITKLLDVEWQVGRSGVISPVAILEPVKIGGATVSRATLHNIKYIEELNLDYGCMVEVIRSGEIIPRVVRRVDYE